MSSGFSDKRLQYNGVVLPSISAASRCTTSAASSSSSSLVKCSTYNYRDMFVDEEAVDCVVCATLIVDNLVALSAITIFYQTIFSPCMIAPLCTVHVLIYSS